MSEEQSQRLRLTFCKGEEIKYISHLDLARTWERAFRRANLPLVYSQGFNPRPRFALGSGLAVGVTSDQEVMDLWLVTPLAPERMVQQLNAQMPRGLRVLDAWEVQRSLPSLQSAMRWAEYRVTLCPGEEPPDLGERVAAFLAAESVPWQREVKGKLRRYDLSPLVAQLELVGDQPAQLALRLATSSEATARVDDVLGALGLGSAACAIRRTRLIWDEDTTTP